MKTGLRLGLLGLIVLSGLAMLWLGGSATALAAQQVTLKAKDTLVVSGDACDLSLKNFTTSHVRINCNLAPGTTPGQAASGVSPMSKIVKTLAANKSLAVSASNCKLKVKTNTPTKLSITCVPLPVTPTPEPTSAGGPDGAWRGSTSQGLPVSFAVTGNQTSWNTFVVEVGFPNCLLQITAPGPAPITNHKMTVGGKFGAGTLVFNGTFTSPSDLNGSITANNATYQDCGSLSGTGSWTASWASSSAVPAASPNSSAVNGAWHVTVLSR